MRYCQASTSRLRRACGPRAARTLGITSRRCLRVSTRAQPRSASTACSDGARGCRWRSGIAIARRGAARTPAVRSSIASATTLRHVRGRVRSSVVVQRSSTRFARCGSVRRSTPRSSLSCASSSRHVVTTLRWPSHWHRPGADHPKMATALNGQVHKLLLDARARDCAGRPTLPMSTAVAK